MNHAQDFLKSKNYPIWTRVQRVVEGGEPAAFKQYFSTWTDAVSGDSGRVGQAKLIHVKIHDNGKLSAETLTDFDQEVRPIYWLSFSFAISYSWNILDFDNILESQKDSVAMLIINKFKTHFIIT